LIQWLSRFAFKTNFPGNMCVDWKEHNSRQGMKYIFPIVIVLAWDTERLQLDKECYISCLSLHNKILRQAVRKKRDGGWLFSQFWRLKGWHLVVAFFLAKCLGHSGHHMAEGRIHMYLCISPSSYKDTKIQSQGLHPNEFI
jgi:hypothetical protein